MNSATDERARLRALLAALDEPARAAAFSPDDPALVAVARHHRLTPLLSIVCGATLPPPLAEAFRHDRVATVARNLMLAQVAEECIRAFAEAGVPTVVLKGLDYETRLYRAAGARPMADVDLLVPEAARRTAFSVLDALGFEPRAAAPGFDEPDYHEVAWTHARAEVDLHMALAPLARCRIDYTAVWEEAEAQRLGGTDARVLARTHAAIFQALHMAIDHFEVPAIYLLDLSRLLPDDKARRTAEALAGRWRCRRAFATATALLAWLVPGWHPGGAVRGATPPRIVARYGATARLSRPAQLVRKFAHFDGLAEATRYLWTQGRRNVRERIEKRIRKRSPRERLNLPPTGRGADSLAKNPSPK